VSLQYVVKHESQKIVVLQFCTESGTENLADNKSESHFKRNTAVCYQTRSLTASETDRQTEQ